jgi:mono/diheme cytochrome c family protein
LYNELLFYSSEAYMTAPTNKWTQTVVAAALVWGVSLWAAIAAPVHAQAPAAPAAAAPAAAAPQATSGIWSGVYSDAQAKRGEGVANKTCVSCHGAELMGGEAGPTLVGLEFLGNWNSLSLGDFFDRIHTTMPADAPGSLTPQSTSDLIAYVLKLNKYPAGEKELPTDMSALAQVKIEGQPPAK